MPIFSVHLRPLNGQIIALKRVMGKAQEEEIH
jgi:hypothetical protein